MSQVASTALFVESVGQTYPNGVAALRGVSLMVQPGEVFGLVGPNGAGKSTLLKVCCGMLCPASGRVLCGDVEVTSNPKHAATWIGMMPDPLGVYTDITSAEYLEFYARLYGLSRTERRARISQAVERLDLGAWLEEEVETLSAGWQRRLALGRVLLAGTPVLLLDEPAAGLDVKARSELLAIIRGLAADGRTVVVSSHILPELETLADQFAILDKGQWLPVLGANPFFTRQDIAAGFGDHCWTIRTPVVAAAATLLQKAGYTIVGTTADSVVLKEPELTRANQALATLVNAGLAVQTFSPQTVGLNELVLKMLRGDPT